MLGPRDVHTIAQLFEPRRLTLAREYQGLTRSDLARVVGKTPSAISQFETGSSHPDPQTVALLALALGVPAQFFAHKLRTIPIQLEQCHFRSLRSATQRTRRQLLAVGTLTSELVSHLHQYVTLPAVQTVPSDRHIDSMDDIESQAAELRRSWGLGMGPIPNMAKLLELKGVILCPISGRAEEVDAFSLWQESRPFMFLLTSKRSTSRTRFDAAHELGHLTMHADAIPGNPELERQAHRFGAAFLMPRDSFIRECPSRFNWEHFCELKRRWKVSISAMIRRAYELGRLSHSGYRRAYTYLNRTNQRRAEPFEPDPERPRMLSRAVELLSERLRQEIAFNMGLRVEHVRALTG